MTQEDIENLESKSAILLAVLDKNSPFFSNGKFDAEKVKSAIIEMTETAIQDREKAGRFIGWMEKHEFFTSPASAKYHANIEGGLAAHSLMVTRQSLVFAPPLFKDFLKTKRASLYTFTATDIFIAGISHDFCKAGFYSTEHRKTKNLQGNWTYEPYFKVKSDSRNLGHGNESVLRLLESLPEYLDNRPVLEAISRHMGFSDLSPNESCNYSNFLQNPLVLLLQLADQSAAQWRDC